MEFIYTAITLFAAGFTIGVANAFRLWWMGGVWLMARSPRVFGWSVVLAVCGWGFLLAFLSHWFHDSFGIPEHILYYSYGIQFLPGVVLGVLTGPVLWELASSLVPALRRCEEGRASAPAGLALFVAHFGVALGSSGIAALLFVNWSFTFARMEADHLHLSGYEVPERQDFYRGVRVPYSSIRGLSARRIPEKGGRTRTEYRVEFGNDGWKLDDTPASVSFLKYIGEKTQLKIRDPLEPTTPSRRPTGKQ